ncbi:DNA alkylation repair protein [Micromonospora purpureochromogenes]|uniref:DNA alkylation repair protein n=1 Tax=Micromonospora purpureochromogenes TaxID=47872 RepID=UPI00340F2126
MTDPTGQAWTLYRGDELLADLVVNGGDFLWLNADVHPYADFEDVRPLFDQELRLLDDIDNHVEEWEAAYEKVRASVTLRYPDGREVPEFLLHIDKGAAWWRWSDEAAAFRHRLHVARDGQEAEVTEATVAEVMAELAALEDPKAREVNEKHGDDHGVNLSKLRALAKRLKTQQELACKLWKTDDTAARLLAILICRPKAFERDELDVMLREARTPKVHDWLVNYVVKKNPHSEELRLAWSADPDPVVASAGWALTTERVAKKPEGLDLAGLLDVIEAEMKDAPDRLQWAMNHCLAQIGIEHAEHRARAIDIGERLEVLKDYPTSPGCTSPFAPIWISEMVRRQHDK